MKCIVDGLPLPEPPSIEEGMLDDKPAPKVYNTIPELQA